MVQYAKFLWYLSDDGSSLMLSGHGCILTPVCGWDNIANQNNLAGLLVAVCS